MNVPIAPFLEELLKASQRHDSVVGPQTHWGGGRGIDTAPKSSWHPSQSVTPSGAGRDYHIQNAVENELPKRGSGGGRGSGGADNSNEILRMLMEPQQQQQQQQQQAATQNVDAQKLALGRAQLAEKQRMDTAAMYPLNGPGSAGYDAEQNQQQDMAAQHQLEEIKARAALKGGGGGGSLASYRKGLLDGTVPRGTSFEEWQGQQSAPPAQ